MRPAPIIGPLERPVLARTELTADPGRPLLRLALATEPGPRRHCHDTVTC
jgi:hypothetical protein